VTSLCQRAHCGSPAEVVVETTTAQRLNLCWAHLRQTMRDQGRLLAAFHRLDWHPRCCQDGCSRMAEHTILDANDLTRPLCRRHLDDLSRVPLRSRLVPDGPRCSGG
jgi:hypothetical protein